jgi:hypothetical protein
MKRILLCGTLLGLMIPVLGQANLVTNGSFDANSPASQTAPAGWTLTLAASGADFFVGSGPGFGALSAPNSANFGSTGNFDDVLSQTLATQVGQTYTVDFWLAHDDSDSGNDFSASFGGTTLLSLVNTNSFGYTEYTFNATATGSSTVLSFAGRENPAWYDLDNVSVNGTATPEPSSYFLVLMIGLAGMFVVARRRQAQQ